MLFYGSFSNKPFINFKKMRRPCDQKQSKTENFNITYQVLNNLKQKIVSYC